MHYFTKVKNLKTVKKKKKFFLLNLVATAAKNNLHPCMFLTSFHLQEWTKCAHYVTYHDNVENFQYFLSCHFKKHTQSFIFQIL